MMRKIVASGAFAVALVAVAQEPSVRLEPAQLQGSRALEKQTETSVVRDYLHSWSTLRTALDANQPALLDADFIGTAHEKLANAITDQLQVGIHTRYQDTAHDLRIVFYSPEGLSIQMLDTVEYDQQVLDHDKVLATKHMHARYIVVLTPAETRWKVRIFQADVS